MDNNTVRRTILELLYQEAIETGMTKFLTGRPIYPFLESNNISKSTFFFNINYLTDKQYISATWCCGPMISSYSLTSHGIDLLEDESEFNQKFPLNSTVIYGNNNMVGNENTINSNNIHNSIDLPNTLITQLDEATRQIQQASSKETKLQIAQKFCVSSLKNIGVPVLIEIIKRLMIQ